VAPSDAVEKNRNMGAELQSLRCTTAPSVFLKIYFMYDFGAHKLIRRFLDFSQFLTTIVAPSCDKSEKCVVDL